MPDRTFKEAKKSKEEKELQEFISKSIDNAKTDDQKVLWKPNSQVQIDFLSAWEDEVLFSGGRGPLAYGEKVLTVNGFRNIEDVKIGDKVICPDNTVSRVIDIPFDGEDDCYEFEFIDGRKVISSVTHKWPVSISCSKIIGSVTRTTKEIVDHYRSHIEGNDKSCKKYMLFELPESIDLESGEELPIDPYLLGLLLGDGSISQETIKLTTVDQEIIDSVNAIYTNGTNYSSDDILFLKPKDLKDSLKKLGLFGCTSANKFIPREYLVGPVRSRLALLQGLMDTDGTVDKKGHPSYTSVSLQLAKDVQELIWSLGGKATISSKVPFYRDKEGNKVYCKTAYTLYIQIRKQSDLFRLTRKKERCTDRFYGGTSIPKLRLTKVTYVGKCKCKCITIDHPDHKFLTNDFIVTYNSGKSDCLLIDPLRWVQNRNFRGLIIRRTMPELRELIDRAKKFYQDYYPGTKWKDQDKLFLFPSGAKIEFGYCETSDDVERYRGQQYTWLGIDEITQFGDDTMLDKLKASLRSTDPTIPIYIRATTNPSGAGCRWVKSRWIDAGPENTTIVKKYKVFGKDYTVTRRWFNSKPTDNPDLMKNNPNYLASLGSIDNEILRRQWLDGEWVSDGLAFDEFSPHKHVIEPFKIPSNWPRFRACDWGYKSMAVCLWFAVDFDGTLYVYRELKTKEVLAEDFANRVLELEQGENIGYGVLDASVWAQRGQMGETPAETMIRSGCFWTPSDSSKGSRVAGKHLIHQYLAVDPNTGEPRVKIFNTCLELIKELSNLPLDPHNPEDVDTKAVDHAYDAFRYGVSSRPQIFLEYSDEWDDSPGSRASGSYSYSDAIIDPIFGY